MAPREARQRLEQQMATDLATQRRRTSEWPAPEVWQASSTSCENSHVHPWAVVRKPVPAFPEAFLQAQPHAENPDVV
jgi:hypothetical protein